MELRDGRVWQGSSAFADLEPASVDGIDAVAVRPLLPGIMDRELARELVTALAPIDRPVALGDELTRTEARLAGWTGPLRAPLTPPGPMPPGGVAVVPPLAVVQDLLPGVDVSRRGFGRTVLHLRAVAADGGFRMRLKAPDRSDLMPEIVAAALDTAFAIRRRYGRMASGVHTITIDDGAGGMDDHMTAGSTQGGSGTIFLETSLAFADALSADRLRRGGRRGCRRRCPARFHIDGVVAHEYWHNLDTTVATTPGSTSSSTAPSARSSAWRRSSTAARA